MIQCFQSGVCLFGAVVVGASVASADVTEFQVAKLHIYEQASSSAPVTPSVYLLDSYIDTFAGDATSASLNGVNLPEDFPGEWTVGLEYASQAELDAAFPGFVFNMHLQGGVLGVRDETVVMPSPAIYPAPAAITPASFTASQGADPTQDLLIEWSAPGGGTNAVFLAIYDVASDMDVFDAEIPLLQTSFLISASQLSPNSEYEVELVFANANFDFGHVAPGFGLKANSIAGYASVTAMTFTTGVEQSCSDVGFAGVVKIADYEQIADNTAPAVPFIYGFDAFVDTEIGGIMAASVIGGAMEQAMVQYLPGSWDAESVGYASQSQLDAEFPSSTAYTIHIEGGTLGVRDQGITIGVDDYPAVPYLVGTGYSDLQAYDTTHDLTIEWATPSANVTHIFADIYNLTADTKVFEVQLPSNTTSILLAAGDLVQSADYEAVINFVAAPEAAGDDCPGFGTGSTLLGGFVSATTIFFTTQSDAVCTPDLNGDGFLNFFDISAFLMAFANMDPSADFNNDGFFNFFDISAFLMEFSAGCP